MDTAEVFYSSYYRQHVLDQTFLTSLIMKAIKDMHMIEQGSWKAMLLGCSLLLNETLYK